MKALLEFVGNKNHLKLGKYNFSPIMEASAGIALEYCKKIEKDKQESSPMFFCFPEKKGASLWTSIAILTNFFLEDYIDNVVDGIVFKKFDKVKIYDCIAEIERITEDKIYLRFSDQGSIPINKKLKSQLSKVNSARVLSLTKRFFANHKEAKTKRNAISKILVPNDPETINQNNLDSKVLLIAGRGNIKEIQELLNNIIIYDEPLSKIYPEKKNLIISPDLKVYKDLFNIDKETQLIKFKESLKMLEEYVELEDVKLILKEFNTKLHKEVQISLEFDIRFISFLNEYKSEISKLEFLEKIYPGYQNSLPENLRAVVINDISQINDYPETIKGFLRRSIPVIFVSNRNVENTFEIDFYQRLFNNNPEYYRLNWNRKKIRALNKCSLDVKYIDEELWTQCKRYARQKVKINISVKNDLDTLAPKLLKQIRDLDGFEILQKAFYNYFYPALYALKNSIRTNDQIKDLILEFQMVFNEVKNTGILQEIVQDFEKAIYLAYDFKDNTKCYDSDSNIFSNLLPTSSHNKMSIPVETIKVNIPTSNTENILFTGYPYNEYHGKYLLNSVCLDFIPNVKILCWPIEASLTMSYLKRRMKSGYFCDFLLDTFPMKTEYLLKTEIDFEAEIDLFLNIDNSLHIENTQEANLDYLHTFKYKGYGIPKDGEILSTVKCDIINFDDGSFMFLPKRSMILAQSEDNQGKTTIKETSFNELNIGCKIFKYKKDRSTYREISKHDKKIEDCFEKLENWKYALESIYKSSEKNLDTLEKLLAETKEKHNLTEGNPIRSSIQRWLFDDEIICPRSENLKIILLAAKVENFDQKLIELEKAFREVSSYTIGLSSNIKKNITNQLSSETSINENFIVKINENEIKVVSKTIASLDRNGIEIDYHNTRKILC
ncbi:hypothetical protein [Flavobacterium sp.]|uniref:hypothetical protein n=1 Tax=Flavobacterium sp. TaxID=239 RepID=UPI002B4B6F57|nr:hypothetical protein [Flavobacterium sp.]HLF52567.1 hypothetical protein [Flavobacterium sp.]